MTTPIAEAEYSDDSHDGRFVTLTTSTHPTHGLEVRLDATHGGLLFTDPAKLRELAHGLGVAAKRLEVQP